MNNLAMNGQMTQLMDRWMVEQLDNSQMNGGMSGGMSKGVGWMTEQTGWLSR